MKISILLIVAFAVASTTFAEEPRTVGVYKRHMATEEHGRKDFDHTLHHMLYLNGVADGFNSINKQRKASQAALLYCLPAETKLSGADYIRILQDKLDQTVDQIPDSYTVAEAMLIALQEEFPCNGE